MAITAKDVQELRKATGAGMMDAKRALTDANLSARGGQRTPLRRLTRLEYGYTIADLLGVSKRTVESHLTHARAWLRRELKPSD